MVRERGKRRPVMPVADELKLLAACSDHLRPIVITALDTGMRRGELLNQVWEHVDFDRKLHLGHALEDRRGRAPAHSHDQSGLRAARGPTQSFRRDLHLRGRADPTHLRPGGRVRSVVQAFPITDFTISGIPSIRDRSRQGVIADVRKELMGHSRGGDVQSLYTHIELPTLRDAIHRLETWHAEKVQLPRRSAT